MRSKRALDNYRFLSPQLRHCRHFAAFGSCVGAVGSEIHSGTPLWTTAAFAAWSSLGLVRERTELKLPSFCLGMPTKMEVGNWFDERISLSQ